LYNCPSSSLYNFKVLKCEGGDCNVFFQNNSPEGGFTAEVSLSRILTAFRSGGCTLDGAPVAKSATRQASSPAAAERPSPGVAPDNSCIHSTPPTVSMKAVAPSPALIKRVIYERYRDMESGRQVGVSFASLVLASSFVNRQGAGGLLHQSAPVGAKVYRYKADLSICVKFTDSILKTSVKEGYFRCFRDRSGAWACTDDGRRAWEQTYLPVN
jgi:hypothetical protein